MRENFKPAPCHPDRRHAAKGLCFPCYSERYPKAKRATCHPDRVAHVGGFCRVCYDRELKQRDPEYAERQKRNFQQWKEINGLALQEYRRTYNQNGRVKFRSKVKDRERVLAQFGLTWEDEMRVREQQGNVCAICRQPPQRERFDIDHDHVTGKFRGLLCGRCNKGLGLLGDNEEGVAAALEYLRRSREDLI